MSQGILSKIFRGPRSASSVTHNLVVKYKDLLKLSRDFKLKRLRNASIAIEKTKATFGMKLALLANILNPYSKRIFSDTSFT